MMKILMRLSTLKLLLAGTILFSLLPSGLSILAPSQGSAGSSASQEATKGNSAIGRKLYHGKGLCYQCHGYDGDLNRRTVLDRLNPEPADLRNPKSLKSKNDQERFDTVKNGHRGTAMFPHQYLKDAEINDILAYLSVLRSERKSQTQGSGKIHK